MAEVDGFRRYMRSEISSIDAFRVVESKRLGRELTRDEAAQLWVDTGRAAQFRKQYERGDNGRQVC
jgi:hypothetical protein